MWRDIKDNMWLGEEISLNDPLTLPNYVFRWKINNKRATRKEVRAEWVAVRNCNLGFYTDAQIFENLTVLYVPSI